MKKKVIILAFLVISILLFGANTQQSDISEAEPAVIVWITETGAKYHNRDCRTIKNSKRLSSISLDDAILLGYAPCKVCKPITEQNN